MAWTNLTYAFLSVLTSTKMTQNQANFAALAAGASGSPQWVNRMKSRVLAGAGSIAPATDCVIKWDLSAGDAALTLPLVASCVADQLFIIKKTDADAPTGGIGTINPQGGQTIDGAASAELTMQNEVIRIIATATGFIVV